MDEEEAIIEQMIEQAPQISPELVGAYLGRCDWRINGEMYGMITRAWSGFRGCAQIEPGRPYLILRGGEWVSAVLVAIIPNHPDYPSPEISDAWGLWQVGHPAAWLLLTDRWLGPATIRPAE